MARRLSTEGAGNVVLEEMRDVILEEVRDIFLKRLARVVEKIRMCDRHAEYHKP